MSNQTMSRGDDQFYNHWLGIAKTIFCSAFVDQLVEMNCSDVWRQLQQSRNYLHGDKDGQQLHPDANIKIWETTLGIDHNEIKRISKTSSDEKEQKYQLAVAAIQKAVDDFRDCQRRNRAFHDLHGVARSDSEECDNLGNIHSVAGTSYIDNVESDTDTIAGCFNSMTTTSDLLPSFPRFQFDLSELKTYTRPRPSFKKYKSFKDILECVQGGENRVIHVYGMSGSGKSQAVRAVCEHLDKTIGNFIIFHVQCQRDMDLVKKKWQEFINSLERAGLLTNDDKHDLEIDGEDLKMQRAIHIFKKFNLRALFVVEDVTKEENNLVQKCVTAVLDQSDDNQIIQMVTVDQVKNAFYIQEDIDALNNYVVQQVTGFTEEEAEEFLNIPNQNSSKKERQQLAKVLAYSPLRLLLAKIYCQTYGESYKKYFEGLGKDQDVIDVEKKIMDEHPELHGLGENHGYEVILKILKPREEGGEKEKREERQFEVIKMMSFLNNENIPDLLIGRLFQAVEEISNEQIQKEVMYLLQKLESKCDASVCDTKLSHEYGNQLLNIHMDILHAVRMSMSEDEKAKVLVNVVQAMISLVGKENRLRTDSVLLYDMLNHMNHVTELGVQFLEKEYKLDTPKKENFELQMSLSRLYEVLGFATTQHSPVTKDDNFEKAIDYLWSIACCYTGNSFFRLCPGNHTTKAAELKVLLHYGCDKNPHQTAKKHKKLKKASEKIPLEFIQRNCSRLFPVTSDLLGGMKRKIGEKQQKEMAETLKKQRYLTDLQLKTLQGNNCLLKPNVLRSIYLTERIASILHSRGRQVLYLKNDITREEQKRYEWYTELGLELCKIMYEDTKVKSIFEYILVANNKLPRMLHSRQNETDDEFWERIEKARQLAMALRDVRDDFYEHGIYKLVSGTPYTILNAMKYLVKAITKLYKKREVAQQHPIPTAIAECEQVYKIAKENAAEFVVASSCIVHVGKFYAAIGEYEKALEVFHLSFNHENGINSQFNKNPNIFAWALYNLGRAIIAGYGKIEDGEKQKKEFMRKYDLLDIPKQLKPLLDETKYILEKTDFSCCC
uniref:LOW QUALITY PROTEIN: uncharacterized protein LOC120345200 n=1 Tax=Styela clava TaxID=7725 RepID=UPI00193A58DC|nr:LOW QUALITY PROTEIN: uncharacterized protein LOC120345200 [Styela clava]